MLRYFYKTLLISFLCGSLLLLDFSFKGTVVSFNSARAESVKTQGIGDGDLMATLTMTSVGLIASRLYTYKQTTDTMIAAAGGAAFIAGEILAYAKLKDVMKDLETQITRDKDGNIDQKQIESLEKLKQSYVEAKETANTKKNLQMAAAAAFAAAAVAAVVLKSSEMLAFQGCSAVLSAAGSACPYSAGAASAANGSLTALQTSREAGGPSMTTKGAETGGLATFTASQATLTASLSASAASYAATCALPYCAGCWACPFVGACNAAAASIQSCNAVSPTCQMTGAYGVFGVIGYTPIMPKKELMSEKKPANYFANLTKFFISDAHADLFSPMGIASSAAIKYLMATNASLGATIDTFLFTPMKRAMAWGILSGLTFAASSSTDGQIQKIEGNIQMIDMILNQMYSYQNGVVAHQTPTVSHPTIEKTISQNRTIGVNGETNVEVDLKAQGTSLPCITSDKPEKCPSFSNQLNSQADFKSMPNSLQSQISSVSKLADGLNGTSKISSSTLSDAKSLANQANALRADMNKQQKELQDKLKASGSKFDIEKEKANLESSIREAVQKELDKNKMNAGEMLASFGGGRGIGSANLGLSPAAVATDASKHAKETKGTKKGAGVAIPVVAVPAAAKLKLDDKDLTDSFKEDSDTKDAALTAEAASKTQATMDEYDLKNDITQDKESSIFELISNRYQKSGYPRLFKRIK